MNPKPIASAELKIRRASLGDLDGIRAFGREFCRHSEAQNESERAVHAYVDGVFARMWSEEYLRFIIQDKSCSLVVVESNCVVAGLALATPKVRDRDAATLSRLCLLPAYRERPVIQHLLSVCEECLPPSVKRVESCVRQSDSDQLFFYESQGFRRRGVVQIGQRPHVSLFVELSKLLRRDHLGPPAATSVRVLREHGWN